MNKTATNKRRTL